MKPIEPTRHKDQARLAREALLLDVALGLLKKGGFQGLNMQAIANQTDYSKGTIYQHFSCKEDVLAKLVVRCGERLLELIDTGLNHATGVRHKIVMASWAFLINAEQEPEVASLVSMVKSPDFQKKVTDANKADLSIIDQRILSQVLSLFTDQADIASDQTKLGVFGWWAMKWGVQDMLANEWELSQFGFDNPKYYFFQSLHVFLDGLGIARDTQSHDFEITHTQAKNIFNL